MNELEAIWTEIRGDLQDGVRGYSAAPSYRTVHTEFPVNLTIFYRRMNSAADALHVFIDDSQILFHWYLTGSPMCSSRYLLCDPNSIEKARDELSNHAIELC